MINLGDRVRDLITGAEGIAVARDEWLNGCLRVGIQRVMKEDGGIPDTNWTDETQCEVLEAGVFVPARARVEQAPAGPRADPPAPMAR